MNFKPLHDRVLVRRIESEDKTAGGLIIPETAQEKPQRGSVTAVGPGRVENGTLFGKWSGTEVKIDGQDLLIMKESDILGLIEGKSQAKAA